MLCDIIVTQPWPHSVWEDSVGTAWKQGAPQVLPPLFHCPDRSAPGGPCSPHPFHPSLPPAGWRGDPPAAPGGPGRRRKEPPQLPAPGRSPMRRVRSSCCLWVSVWALGAGGCPPCPAPHLQPGCHQGSQHGIPSASVSLTWAHQDLLPVLPSSILPLPLRCKGDTSVPALSPGLVTSPGAGQRSQMFPAPCRPSQPCLLSPAQIRALPPWLCTGRKRKAWTSSKPPSAADQRYPWPLLQGCTHVPWPVFLPPSHAQKVLGAVLSPLMLVFPSVPFLAGRKRHRSWSSWPPSAPSAAPAAWTPPSGACFTSASRRWWRSSR